MALKDIQDAVEAWRKLSAEEKVIFRAEAAVKQRKSRKGVKLGPRKKKVEARHVAAEAPVPVKQVKKKKPSISTAPKQVVDPATTVREE